MSYKLEPAPGTFQVVRQACDVNFVFKREATLHRPLDRIGEIFELSIGCCLNNRKVHVYKFNLYE